MVKKSVLIFAFRGTTADKVTRGLGGSYVTQTIASAEYASDTLLPRVRHKQYDYILGMGAYSGRDQDQLRIEKYCSSQFRNDKDNREYLDLPRFITPGTGLKDAAGIGNSWCNLVSYKIMTEIHPTHFTFIHIPKTFDVGEAIRLIDAQLVMLA